MPQQQALISLAQAKQLVEHLETGAVASANEIIQAITIKESADLYTEIGKLTRQLHNSLSNFKIDDRLNNIVCSAIPDAQSRLKYVIEETEKAANSTMNAVERSMPIAAQLNKRLDSIMPEWKKLMTRQIAIGEFKHLCLELDQLLSDASGDSKALNSLLTEVLLAQGYQDLTGQVIKRVMELVKEVENHLVDLLATFGEQELEKGKSLLSVKKNKNDKAEGPVVDFGNRDDVVTGQVDVDDLLSSLGF